MENYRFFFQMFSQISRTPDFERSFRVKRCGLYAGVYGTYIEIVPCESTAKEVLFECSHHRISSTD